MSTINPTSFNPQLPPSMFGVDVQVKTAQSVPLVNVTRLQPPVDDPWTVGPMKNGQATVNLGDNYDLLLNEHSSQIKIVNKKNGEVTNIWGDPHIDWNKDGVTDADFYTKTSFVLEDGTKITIDTEPYAKDPKQYLSNNVTVTRGDQAIEIKGLSQNKVGDMTIVRHDRGGRLLDWQVTDGFIVRENARGEGWINEATGQLATRKDFDITRPEAAKPYEIQQALSQLLQMASPSFQQMVNPGLRLGRKPSPWTARGQELNVDVNVSGGNSLNNALQVVVNVMLKSLRSPSRTTSSQSSASQDQARQNFTALV